MCLQHNGPKAPTKCASWSGLSSFWLELPYLLVSHEGGTTPSELLHLGALEPTAPFWVAVLKRLKLFATCVACQHCSAGENSLDVTSPTTGSEEEVEPREVSRHPCESKPGTSLEFSSFS